MALKPEVVALLERIYAALPEVECQRLCGGYCGVTVVSPTEQARMEQAGWPIRLSCSVTTVHCSFYDVAQSACRVHAVRPLVCRLFGSAPSPRMTCPHGCRVVGSVTNDQVQQWIAEIRALDGEFLASPLV